MTEIVECRSEFTYAQKPVAVSWEGKRLEIDTILANWRTPAGSVFIARTTDGQRFELTYAEAADAWNVRAA